MLTRNSKSSGTCKQSFNKMGKRARAITYNMIYNLKAAESINAPTATKGTRVKAS